MVTEYEELYSRKCTWKIVGIHKRKTRVERGRKRAREKLSKLFRNFSAARISGYIIVSWDNSELLL